MPVGNVSVSGPVMLADVPLGLVKVTVRVEDPPASMVAGLNDLLSEGGIRTTAALTVNSPVAGVVLLPLVVCNAPAGSVLVYVLGTDEVTFTATVQVPFTVS